MIRPKKKSLVGLPVGCQMSCQFFISFFQWQRVICKKLLAAVQATITMLLHSHKYGHTYRAGEGSLHDLPPGRAGQNLGFSRVELELHGL